MSEDCDFRIKLKPNANSLSKEAKRKTLRNFRNEIIEKFTQHGYLIDPENIRVRNEGQFMSIRASYPSLYPAIDGLRPYLALEFFLGEVKMPCEVKPVTTLIQQVLGEVAEHGTHHVNSVSIIETAAEKWVALTRRIATSAYRKNSRNNTLVRHLYDLYQIEKNNCFSDQFELLASRIVNDDRILYKNHNDNYFYDPISEIKRSIAELSESKIWEDYWHQFLDTMVYDDIKPSYQEVITNLNQKTEVALEILSGKVAIWQSNEIRK